MAQNRNAVINDPSLYRTAIRRLKMDFMRLEKEPVDFIFARPDPANIFEWYYVLEGPPKTPYEGGYYLGMLRFPKEYPFKPPSILMLTPNGRFKTNTRLCLSISDFHPESWIPAWHTSTILTGVLSFMTGSDSTLGSIQTSDRERRSHAQASLDWCVQNDKVRDIFPELHAKLRGKLENKQSALAAASFSSTSTATDAAKRLLTSASASVRAAVGDRVDAGSTWSDHVFLALWLILAICGAALFVHFSSSSSPPAGVTDGSGAPVPGTHST